MPALSPTMLPAALVADGPWRPRWRACAGRPSTGRDRRRVALAALSLPVLLLHALVLAPQPAAVPAALQVPAATAAWVRAMPAQPKQPAGRTLKPASMQADSRGSSQASSQPSSRAAAGAAPEAAAKARRAAERAPAAGLAAKPAAQAPAQPGAPASGHDAPQAAGHAPPASADGPPATAAAGPARWLEPTPVYATAPPPASQRRYRLVRGQDTAWAQLHWQPEGTSYTLSLQAEPDADADEAAAARHPLAGLGANSRGRIGPEGLQPERYVDRRQGRDQRAANFDATARTVRGSGGGVPWPFPPGGQDRLSWLLQLAAVLQANPALATPGARIVLPVAGPREAPAAWVFDVLDIEPFTLADGSQRPALALRRRAGGPYQLQAEAWLDPAAHHLPLGWRLATPPGAWSSTWTLMPAAAEAGSAGPADRGPTAPGQAAAP